MSSYEDPVDRLTEECLRSGDLELFHMTSGSLDVDLTARKLSLSC